MSGISVGLAALTLLAQADVGSGKITGGWGYVWASWVITWVIIAAYAAFLWFRTRELKDRKDSP